MEEKKEIEREREREAEENIISYFNSLPYKKQRVLLTKLCANVKEVPFYISFPLDINGCKKMSKVVIYCKKHDIIFESKKVNERKIIFAFENHSVRNEVLIGSMIS